MSKQDRQSGEDQPKPKRATRKWSMESMTAAYKAVKSGSMSLSKASRKFGVPRMTLADRVKGRIQLNAQWGHKPVLSADEEQALVVYIEYMANRGFPLTIGLIIGFAWCIAKTNGKAHAFKKTGPTKQWWNDFKKRHPHLRLRRPDTLDRGRATMGNVWSLREYFSILKEVMDANDFHSNPHLVFNCDEAAVNLNKSAGQKVVVPCNQKHTHTVASATNEHITVHCCVSASGGTIPPMIIFTKTYPGGAYHKNGPVSATYAVSDTGFMDQELYFHWFEKTFLKFAPPQRPLLLIQDGASSHISCPLIKSAIANDVILLCLPPKTTHITQPLDVAVYRKMKIETAKVMSQAKLIKSNLWVAKKNVSQMFRIIYKTSFTMNCIIEGFRKCGIFPFNPNAVDKSLLLRSCDVIDEEDIDLSVNNELAINIETKVQQANNIETEMRQEQSIAMLPMTSTPEKLDDPSKGNGSNKQPVFEDITFVVGDDGILTLTNETSGQEPVIQDVFMSDASDNNVSECPPTLALAAVEMTLTPRKKRKYHECLNFNVDLPTDNVFQTWKVLKEKVVAVEAIDDEIFHAVKLESYEEKKSKIENEPKKQTEVHHPLVKAGLISDNLAEILLVPDFEVKSSCAPNRGKKRARILTSEEVEKELEEKENIKKEKEEKNKQRKIKQTEKKAAMIVKKEEIRQRKEIREKKKATETEDNE